MLHAKTGSQLWAFATGGVVRSSSAVRPEGLNVFVGSRDSKVYVVNAKTGSHCWEFATGNDVDSSPVVSPDGLNVFAGSHDKKVCALIATMGLIKSLSIENNLNNRLLKEL